MLRRSTSAAFVLALAIAGAGSSAAPPAATHYRIKARLDPALGALEAETEISMPAVAARPGASFILKRSFHVASVSASDNATATVEDTDKPFPGLQKLVLTAKPGARGPVSATIRYAGPVEDGDQANAVSPERVELSADSLWFPLSTNFNLRFTLDAEIRGLGPRFLAASPDRVTPEPDGFDLHRTRPSQDIAFAAAPGFRTASAGPLQFFARDLATDQARNYRLYGDRAVKYFQAWFGPLPGGKAVVAIVDRKSGSGYSRRGYLVVADTGTLPKDNLWGRVGYVAHELSHSWWSSADFTGEDYWLVESTAEYSALRFVEHELGTETMQGMLEKKKARAARGGPILGHGRPSNDAVYGRGPLLLFELEKRVGRRKFDAMFGKLARRETLTTADFLEALRRTAGAGVARDFEAKLRA